VTNNCETRKYNNGFAKKHISAVTRRHNNEE
jgi:hypothetical protein